MNNKTHSSFYSYNFLNIGIHKKYVPCYSHSYFFFSYKFWNMGIQKNENSFFTCYFKVALDQFFWNLKFGICPRSIFLKFGICPRWFHFTLLTTDSIRVRKDHKIKINDDSDNDIEFFKKAPSHRRDRLARKVRKSKRLANKKVRESKIGSVIMPTGALLAAGKIKNKYAKK